MNALELLRPPWVASARSSRWLTLVVTVALVLGEIPAFALLDGPPRAAAVGGIWCCMIALWWLLVVPNALWLGRDATALRLPHVRHRANASVLAYAALTALLPAIVFALALGHAFAWYVGFTLAITGCLLLLLMPSWIFIALLIVFVTVTNLHLVHFQPPGVDRLAEYGAILAVVLVVLSVWRWYLVLDMQAPTGIGLRRPAIWNLRTQARLGFFGGAGTRNADAILARSVRPWLAPVPDIRRTGPAHPVRSIRIALGRNVMPQTLLSRVRVTAYSLALMAIFISPSVITIVRGNTHDVLRALVLTGAGGVGFAMLFAIVLPLVGEVIYGWRLPQRWASGNSEFALLTLMPRLGDAPSVRRSMVLACVANALYLGALQLVLLCAAGLAGDVRAAGMLPAFLSSATTVALVAATVLRALAGRPLSGWMTVLLTVLVTAVETVAVAFTFRANGGAQDHVGAFLALALLLLLAVLVALGSRSWRALQRRPHPFLGAAP